MALLDMLSTTPTTPQWDPHVIHPAAFRDALRAIGDRHEYTIDSRDMVGTDEGGTLLRGLDALNLTEAHVDRLYAEAARRGWRDVRGIVRTADHEGEALADSRWDLIWIDDFRPAAPVPEDDPWERPLSPSRSE